MSTVRPPTGFGTDEIFERWLPEAFAAAGCRASVDSPSVRVTLSGKGGGVWEIRAREDEIAVAPPGRQAPDVWVRQSTEDFLAAIHGSPDLPDLLPPRFGVVDLLFLDPRDTDLLGRVSGRIRLEVAGRRGRRWALDVGCGKAGVTAGRPRTTIRLDGATYEGLVAGRLPPMQPLLDGRIQIEGDRGLAMSLFVLLGSRLTR